MPSIGQQFRIEDARRAAEAAIAAGRARYLKRGLVHVIDSRTSDICLDLARRRVVVGADEPFDTLIGEQMHPPFHDHCRTIEVLVVEGDVEPHGATEAETSAEERARETEREDTPRRPNRNERRARRREVDRRLREEERRRREARRRRRAGQTRDAPLTNQLGGNRGVSTTSAPRTPTTAAPDSSVLRVHRRSDGPLPSPAAPRTRTLRDWVGTAAEINRAHDPLLPDDDPATRVLLRRQRWTGRPTVVEPGTLRSWPLGLLVYRGLAASTLPARAYAAALATEAVFLGLGAAGVGIYLALREDDAQQYAGPDGVVVRGGTAPGARIVDRDDLTTARLQALSTLTEREARSLAVVTGDPGRLAAALGYDGVRFPDGTVLLVNRTALVMEDPT